MTLPNAAQAHVAREKITEYLLSPASDRGQHKQAFFVRFGFRLERWEELAEALASHCQRNDVIDVMETIYGIQYAVIGTIATPDGRDPYIKSVWQLDTESDYPRFVTAYPSGPGGRS